MAKNPYSVLGVSENATDEEIRAAYRRLAKQYHPDLNPNDSFAAAKMNDINVAYDQIKTSDKRAAYKASQTSQSTYQQSPYGGFDPWQSYRRTGSGYYGGSYTGDSGNDNEPPFGWGSVFEERRRQQRSGSYSYRPFRLLYLFLIFLMIMMMARCVIGSFWNACSFMCFGSPYDQTRSNRSGEIVDCKQTGDRYEIS